MASPDLSIIIVNWKSKAFLENCLRTVYAHEGDYHYEVVVIDNASFDGSEAMLAAQFPRARFIQSEKNLGFGGANNLAVQHSSSDLLLFLNPDTEVIGDALNRLIDATRALPNTGAVGGTLLNSDGSIQTSSLLAYPTMLNQLLDTNLLRRLFPRLRMWGMAPLFSGQEEPSEVEAISGACIMMRRSVFDQIGGFSTDYFMYSEDTDICYKAHLHGFTNYYVPQPRVIHHGDGCVRSAKSNFAVVMAVESLWRFQKKYRGIGYALAYRCALVVAALGRLLLLSLSYVASLFRGSRRPPQSLPKWNAILRWSLSLESWVVKY